MTRDDLGWLLSECQSVEDVDYVAGDVETQLLTLEDPETVHWVLYHRDWHTPEQRSKRQHDMWALVMTSDVQ